MRVTSVYFEKQQAGRRRPKGRRLPACYKRSQRCRKVSPEGGTRAFAPRRGRSVLRVERRVFLVRAARGRLPRAARGRGLLSIIELLNLYFFVSWAIFLPVGYLLTRGTVRYAHAPRVGKVGKSQVVVLKNR